MARVRALLREQGAGEDSPPVFDDGHLRVDLARRSVKVAGEPVHFTRKEFAVMALLLRNAGRVVTQPQLLRELWGPDHVEDTHYLRIVVGKIRQKLGDDHAPPALSADRAGCGLSVPR